MTKIKSKPNLAAQFEERPLEIECKWTNILFSKHGETVMDRDIYESPQAAAESLRDWIESEVAPRVKAGGEWVMGHPDSGRFLAKDYSHAIQIPILEK